MYFRKYRLQKTWLDKSLKSRVLDDPWRDNMGNGSKHCCNLNNSTSTIFLITVKVVALEKVSFSDIQNPETVC